MPSSRMNRRSCASCAPAGGLDPRRLEGAPFVVAQFHFRQLADRRAGQAVADLKGRRHLVPADLVGQESLELLEGQTRRSVLQLYEDLGGLAPIGVRNADHGSLF